MNCKKCGALLASNVRFCESCGQSVEQEAPAAQNYDEGEAVTVMMEDAPVYQAPAAPAEKPENVLTGTVGALLGAALGAGAIILLSQLGFVASLSGLVLAVCTLKGYELLGNKLSIKGIIICIVLMLLTPYIADRLDWAIIIMKEFASEGVTLGEAFAAVPLLLEDGSIEMSVYLKSLLMVYGFTALGAFGTVSSMIKKKK